MRLAHARTADGALRLAAQRDDGWIDIGAATGDERLATLSGVLAAGAWDTVLAADAPPDPAPEAFGPAIDRPGRIFCVGRNYVAHRDEFANLATPWPEVFLRIDTGVCGPHDEIAVPSIVTKLDYEGEMAVVIARGGRHIAKADALDHVLGFTVANDVSARDWQWRGGQWTGGKNFDGTLPLGPVLVTPDELDWADTLLETRLNGETMQSARTSQFIFDLPTQIEFISSFATLKAGDVIVTGTPGGVGSARTPPVFLKPGDVVEVEIEGIGVIRNAFVEDPLAPATEHWRAVANDGTPRA